MGFRFGSEEQGITPDGRFMEEEMASSSIASGFTYGNGDKESVRGFLHNNQDVNPLEMKNYYQAAEDIHDPKKGFWRGVVDNTMTVFETIGIPFQIGTQLLSKGDWRKAIPSYLAKEQWAKDNIHHETVMSADVLSVWSDGALDEYYEKHDPISMAGEAAIKIASFAPDIFLDPLTYVPVAGAVNVVRKALPIAMRAEFTGRIALKTLKVTHAREAFGVAKKFLAKATKNALDNPGEKTNRVLKAAEKNYATMDEHFNATLSYAKLANEGEHFIPKVTMPKNGAQQKLGAPWSATDQQQASKAYLDDFKAMRDTVRGVDDDVALHNATAQGLDDSGQIADGFAQLIIGTDPSHIKFRQPGVSDFYNSANLPPGVAQSSLDGHLKPAIAALRKTAEEAIEDADVILRGVTAPPEGTVYAKLNKADKEKYSIWRAATKKKEQNESWLDDLVGDPGDAKNNIKPRDPRIPDSLLNKDGLAEELLPASYRRSPLEADDYLGDQWGEKVGRTVAGVMLYPKAIMKMPPAWFNSAVREPSRVLSEQSPEMRLRMVDGLTQYNFGVNTVRKELESIFSNAGIYTDGKTRSAIKGLFVTNPRGKVDKDKASQLFHLLDSEFAGVTPTADSIAKAQKAFAELSAEASPEMMKAHGEMRKLLAHMGDTLDLPNDKLVEGYVPRMRDFASDFMNDAWTENGSLPPDMEGTTGKSFWGQLMDRRGNSTEGVETDIVKIMDSYSRGYGRKMYLEPMNQDLTHMARLTGIADPSRAWISKYTEQMVKNINGEASAVNVWASNILGGKNSHLAKSAAGMTATLGYSAALTGNMRYPVMSILQSLNTTSAKYGPLRTLRGVGKMMTAKGKAEAQASGVNKEINQIYQGVSSLAARAKVPGTKSIQDTEFYIRGLTYHAALGDELTARGFKSIDDVAEIGQRQSIIAHAVRETEEANHVFGSIGRPVGFSRLSGTGATVATQFFSFPFKQTETLANIALDNPGQFMDYLYVAGKIQTAAADGLNIDVSNYTGIGFVTDIPEILSGDRETIPVNAMSNMHQLVFAGLSAMNNPDDAVAVQDAEKAFAGAFEMMMPGTVGADQYYRGFNELRDIVTTGETQVRKSRRHSVDALVRSGLGQGSFSELKFGELSYSKDSSGLASIFTGMTTIEGKIEREVQQSTYKRSQQTRALQVSLTDELWDITRTGNDDPRRVNDLVSQLRATGVDYKDLSAIKDRQTKIGYAANMTVRAREGILTNEKEKSIAGFTRAQAESSSR
jgi:hypothetical protein